LVWITGSAVDVLITEVGEVSRRGKCS